MSAELRIDGIEEFKQALRDLPEALAAEGDVIVIDEAFNAEDEIRSTYPVRTGNLATHLRTDVQYSRYGVIAVVKNTAPHAWLFEHGTQARHTDIGANRGSMPPGNVFIPCMIRHRWNMYRRLRALLEAHGLLVKTDLPMAA